MIVQTSHRLFSHYLKDNVLLVFHCFRAVNIKDKKPTLSPAFLSRVPVDDVWIRAHYPRPQLSLEESLVRHKEFADPSMLDNMEGFVYADIELNMKTNKKVIRHVVCVYVCVCV